MTSGTKLCATHGIVACVVAIGICAMPARAAVTPDPVVESILARALTERGASHACALTETDAEAAERLERSWTLDLEDSVGLLRSAGYADANLSE